MASPTDERGYHWHRQAYVLFADGLSLGFTNEPQLVGTGASSWIGQTDATRELKIGLTVPDSIRMAIDPRTGQFSDSSVTFQILEDSDGTIAQLFGTENVPRDSILSLRSTDDPAPATVPEPGGGTENVRGRHVGVEAIGSAGERRQFHCFPFSKGIPLDHIARVPDFDPSLYVSDDPLVFEGRWFSLYRVIQTHPATYGDYRDWEPWGDQHDAGGLVFWGKLRDRGVIDHGQGRVWSLSCAGPESLLEKRLNQGQANPEWYKVDSILSLSNDTGSRNDLIAVGFFRFSMADDLTLYDASLFNTNYPLLSVTVDGLASEISAIIQGTANDTAGGSGNYVTVSGTTHFTDVTDGDWKGQEVYFDEDMIKVRCNAYAPTELTSEFGLELCMHIDIWHFLGWDVRYKDKKNTGPGEVIRTVGQNTLDVEDPFWVDFFGPRQTNEVKLRFHDAVNAPGPGYVIGRFSTRALGTRHDVSSTTENDNDGQWRRYFPINSASVGGRGKQTILRNEGGQIIGLYGNLPYVEGQHDRPVSSFSKAGITPDETRRWVFRGPNRRGSEDSARDDVEYHVAKCSWLDSGGAISEFLNTPALLIERWEDPRLYGFENLPLDRDWLTLAGEIECTPLAVWDYESPATMPKRTSYIWTRLEQAYSVMQRIMLSTGTSTGWTGTEEAYASATVDIGMNTRGLVDEVGTDIHSRLARDIEIADLGLGIPAVLVEKPSEFKAAFDGAGKLGFCKLCAIGDVQAADLLASLMQPAGLSWRLSRTSGVPRYGLFRVAQTISPANISIQIDETDLHGDTDDPTSTIPMQQLRWAAAVDEFAIDYRMNPESESYLRDLTMMAMDHGSRYRSGRVEHRMKGDGLALPELAWANLDDADWQGSFRSLWGRQAAEWWAARHFLVSGLKIKRTKAWEIEVGTYIRLTNVWLVLPDGTYGLVSGSALILATDLETSSGAKTVDALVDANSLQIRVWAPIARVLGYDATSSPKILKCAGDYWGTGVTSDVAMFVNPDWTGLASTDASIQLWSYDRGSWAAGPGGLVDSVDTSTHEMTLTGSLSAGIERDKIWFVTLDPYDSQNAAWAKAIFSVVTDTDHFFGSVPTRGFRLLP